MAKFRLTIEQLNAWVELARAIGLTTGMTITNFKKAMQMLHPGISSAEIDFALKALNMRAEELAKLAAEDSKPPVVVSKENTK